MFISQLIKCIWRIEIYIIFQIIRAILHGIQCYIYPVPFNYGVIHYEIIGRRKMSDGEKARITDFIGRWKSHEKFEFLLDKHWSLYTVSEKYACFVRTPRPATFY